MRRGRKSGQGSRKILRMMEGHVVLCTLFNALLEVIYTLAEEEFEEFVALTKKKFEEEERMGLALEGFIRETPPA